MYNRRGFFSELPPLREVIANHKIIAKKTLGQNFLLDLNLTHKIARAGVPLEGQVVLEIVLEVKENMSQHFLKLLFLWV